MSRVSDFLCQPRAKRRPGAEEAALGRIEEAFDVVLPPEFREWYRLSDGLDLDGSPLEFFPLERVLEYAGCIPEGFAYVPFADRNDSNPFCLCGIPPLTGFIAHVFHDDVSVLFARNLEEFLDALDRAAAPPGNLQATLDFTIPERTEADATVGRELIRLAQTIDSHDLQHGDALRFAAHLFGPGHENDLRTVLSMGNEYVRDVVLARLRNLGTDAAQQVLRQDAADYRRFIESLADSLRTAGFEATIHQAHGAWAMTVQPGNIGLNLSMLYAGRNTPGTTEGFIERLQQRRGT